MLKQTDKVTRYGLVAALFMALIITGCTKDSTGTRQNSQISILDASASMRVEVEVYKGPLSKEISVQFAELEAITEDSKRALEILHANMTVSAVRLGCAFTSRAGSCTPPEGKAECTPTDGIDNQPEQVTKSIKCNKKARKCKKITDLLYDSITIQRPSNLVTYKVSVPKQKDIPDKDLFNFCNTLGQLLIDVRELNAKFPGNSGNFEFCSKEASIINESSRANCLDELKKFSRYGSHLEQRASYWAAENVATMPDSTRLRIEMANFAQFVKDYGNKIIARSDALVKQLAGAKGVGITRQQLANSVFLRDSSPTAYLNLYQWNKAAVSRNIATPEDRTRMVEQLVADTYWANINTVFAAGQGDVSMALVKDDIGNWNLKSFDNSPNELLQAYKNAGLAAVKSVADLARSNGLSQAKNALSFANQIALGSTSSERSRDITNRLKTLRMETARQIDEIGTEMGKRNSMLNTSISTLTAEIGDASSGLTQKQAMSKKTLDEETKAAVDISKIIYQLTTQIATSEMSISKLETNLEALRKARETIQGAVTTTTDLEDPQQTSLQPNSALAQIDEQIAMLTTQFAAEAKTLTDLIIEHQKQSNALKSQETKVALAKADFETDSIALNMAKNKLVGEQTALANLTKDTTRQIRQLLDLHRALIARMAEAVAEEAGPTASVSDILLPLNGKEEGSNTQKSNGAGN